MIAPLRDFDSEFNPPTVPAALKRRFAALAAPKPAAASSLKPAAQPLLSALVVALATVLYLGLLWRGRG